MNRPHGLSRKRSHGGSDLHANFYQSAWHKKSQSGHESLVNAVLIGFHQANITGHVGGQNRGQPTPAALHHWRHARETPLRMPISLTAPMQANQWGSQTLVPNSMRSLVPTIGQSVNRNRRGEGPYSRPLSVYGLKFLRGRAQVHGSGRTRARSYLHRAWLPGPRFERPFYLSGAAQADRRRHAQGWDTGGIIAAPGHGSTGPGGGSRPGPPVPRRLSPESKSDSLEHFVGSGVTHLPAAG
jgi:hypothetical protein